jgi:APA family basic amino acid/polyamine antiporter
VNLTPARKPPSIGLVSLVCLVIGNMIGAGVYISTSYALDALGDARLVLLAWAIGGMHAICGAIAYAALARRVRLSGGEYAFLSRFVHPAIGFMAGWISIVAGFTAPIAAAALVFGEYLCEAPKATAEARWVATAWILLCGGFHWIHLRAGAWVNNGAILLKFVGFAIFAIACILFLNASPTAPVADAAAISGGNAIAGGNTGPAWDRTLFASDYWGRLSDPEVQTTLLVQLFFISLAYTGFNASIYLAGEMHDANAEDGETEKPARIVSQSMVLACVVVTLLYLGLNGLFLATAPRETIIAGRDYFVSDVADYVGGPWLRWVIRITIALSSATSVLAMMATGPRVVAQMARDGWLPRWLEVHGGVPRGAIVLQSIASVGLVWSATVAQLIGYLGLTLTVCGAVATSTLWIAYREMQSRAPIRGWEHLALGLYAGGALVLLGTAWRVAREQFWWSVGTFLSGLAIFGAAKAWPRLRSRLSPGERSRKS